MATRRVATCPAWSANTLRPQRFVKPGALAARSLAAVAAADGGGLRADHPRRRAVARPPDVPRRWLQFFDARYARTARVLWPTAWAAPGVWPPCGTPARPVSCRHRLPARGLAAPWHTHDMAQVATLHAALRPGEVLVGDRAFCSFVHLALLRQQGHHAVFRVHQKQMVISPPPAPTPPPRRQARGRGCPAPAGSASWVSQTSWSSGSNPCACPYTRQPG